MKTTIDIPESLYRRVESCAKRRSETVEQFLIEVLEDLLSKAALTPFALSTASPLFDLDEFGFPMLSGREGVQVTDEVVNRIREEEGI